MESGLILIVDDEPSVYRALHPTLDSLGFKTMEASSGEQALSLLHAHAFDAILLDINMPGMNGIDACREIRYLLPRIPILMLTVRDSEDDKVEGLDAGANDFITKPFRLRELMARVRAAIRRARVHIPPEDIEDPVICIGAIKLDPLHRTVKKAGRLTHLTPKEFELTRILMKHAGRVVPHRRLLALIWGQADTQHVNYLRVLVRQLRNKIEDEPSAPQYILTRASIGYTFADPWPLRSLAEEEPN
jgi:two-component system KDP operon response regulator KdpE